MKSKDGHIKVPSGKALVELLDTFYYAVYKMTQKKTIKKEGSSEKSENDQIKVHPFAVRSTLFPSDTEEIGGSSFKQSSQNGYTNEDVADSFCEDNDSVDGSIDLEKISNELITEIEKSENVIKKAPTDFVHKQILLWALIGPCSREPAEYMKVAISKNLNVKSEKIVEVSKDSLKALRDEAGKCENSSNKKAKYDDKQKYEYLTKRNEIYESLVKQNGIQQTIQTKAMVDINDNLQQDSILLREQVIITRAIDNAKDNLNLIRDEMDEMRKDGDDKTDPEKFRKLKNEKDKASVLLKKLLTPPANEALFTPNNI